MKLIMDLTGITSEDQLYQAAQSKARNLDALYDALTEQSDVTIRADKDILKAVLGTRAQAVIRLLEDAQQENHGLMIEWTQKRPD